MSRENATIMTEFISRHINEAYQKLQVLLVVGHSLSLPCSKMFHKTTVPQKRPQRLSGLFICLISKKSPNFNSTRADGFKV